MDEKSEDALWESNTILPRALPRRRLFCGAVEHPVDAEAIGQRAPIGSPEHFLQRHFHRAAFLECGEQAVGRLENQTVVVRGGPVVTEIIPQ